MTWRSIACVTLGVLLTPEARASERQQVGSIRGVVYDADFGVPLAGARVSAVEADRTVESGGQGNYVIADLPAGAYTLVFAKEGYVRAVRPDVVVIAGRLTEVDVSLSGDFTEMDEFVVQDVLQLGGTAEIALLQMRFESPALMDSVSSELMSRAGASDAASGLRLVAGASVQDGKTAVIRGLPDRYVSSQLNGVRLPSADEDKRAVELDQFPAAVIESIQVSKTFTPDQQGDASGGAVDVRLKGIPDETIFEIKGQISHNSQAGGRSDFLTYDGGGVGTWGTESGEREIQYQNLGGDWDGAVGVSHDDAPVDYKWSAAAGGKHVLDSGLKLGGFASLFYERDSSFYDDGVNDSYWVENPGDPLTPETSQGTPQDGDFRTSLFDVAQGSQSVQWGGLAALGLESERHALALTFLHTRTAEDTATLATDTRGKAYFFPGYDPNDPMGPGNDPANRLAAPYLRTETLEYVERTTTMLQLTGRHTLPFDGFEIGDLLAFREPELEWSLARSSATLDQPDKRQFGAYWAAASHNPGLPPWIPPSTDPPVWGPFKPSANFNLGNLQRIWAAIDETSEQGAIDLVLPFEQWGGEEGYAKLGVFDDRVDREFDQDTFSNFGDAGASYQGGWNDPWSAHFPSESHPITASTYDVDYEGEQDLSAFYAMVDLPLSPSLKAIGGARRESTEIRIVNIPEADATWIPPGATAPQTLNPGDADVAFEQDDVLPSIGLVWSATDRITLRGSYSRTVARQTFKELTPILQQEYLGAPVFVGNPDLAMSSLDNFDLRADWEPYEGGLVSVSWFDKRIDDPIEYVQKVASFTYTTAVNYPEGDLAGYEVELRQDVGRFFERLEGLSIGVNATFIDSSVTLPDDEAAGFNLPEIQAPMRERDMTAAPEYLYNLYATYDVARTGTRFGLFYTVQGDTLVAGAGQSNGNFVPSVYATEFDTLNASVSQRIGKHLRLELQAKNLTNPDLTTVYRSEYTGDDVVKTSYTAGIEYALTLGATFSF
jgi:outer membrane receptor protein involved in Fe transport